MRDKTEIERTDGYREGFDDAFSFEPEPLFPDAAPEYRAGWWAGIECREIVRQEFNI